MHRNEKIDLLVGLTMATVTVKDGEEVVFVTKSEPARTFRLFHYQDCCESVRVEDVAGDLTDLVDSPILYAEESSSNEPPEGCQTEESDTWTFYRIGTIKGAVVIRFHGSSNGCYSESVDFAEEGVERS